MDKKMLLNIESWGVRLYEIEIGKKYEVGYDDSYAPLTHMVTYETLDEALGDIVNYLLDPKNIYAMDEQPENFQRVYALAGAATGCNPVHPEINEVVGSMLYYVLLGIVYGNE